MTFDCNQKLLYSEISNQQSESLSIKSEKQKPKTEILKSESKIFQKTENLKIFFHLSINYQNKKQKFILSE